MRAFKNLDYFRKSAPEHSRATVIGGLISLLSLGVIYHFNHYSFLISNYSQS